MPLPISKMACMHIGDNERSVLIVPPKRDQSLIIFGRAQTRTTTSRESDNRFGSPTILSLCTVNTLHDEKNGVRLNRWDGLNFDKGQRILYNLSCRKENQPTIMTAHTGGRDMSLHLSNLNQNLTRPYHYNLQIHPVGILILVWGWSSKSSSPIWHLPIRRSKTKISSHSTPILGSTTWSSMGKAFRTTQTSNKR